jgi:hypothetical protein
MDFGKIFTRAWEIIWNNKFLILLGVLVALGGTSGGGGNPTGYTFDQSDFDWQQPPQFDYDLPPNFPTWDISPLVITGVILLIVAAIVIGFALWVLGTISRGGLIYGVYQLDSGETTDFSDCFRAGWKKGWRLIGIGLIPAIPGLVLFLIGIFLFIMFGGLEVIFQGNFHNFGWGFAAPIAVLACLMVPVAIVLSLLRTFANRACMLEDQSIISAYRRGFEVLGDNLGPAILLGLLQLALSIGIGVMMIIPSFLMALCCLLWPILLLIEGAFVAYYSSLWTLAWKEWTLITE